MPELPEVEITARRLDEALRGAEIVSALAPGVKAMRTFDPPLTALEGQRIERVGRRGKHFVIETDGPAHPLVLLIHLMSAGRLQLYDRRAGLRDRTSRLLVRVRLDEGEEERAPADEEVAAGAAREHELRLREFGSKQAAWVKLLRREELERDESLATLGPEAWPASPPLAELLDGARPLHAVLRDQHTIAGIGRSWVDEILWEAQLSPFKRAGDLSEPETAALEQAIVGTLGMAIDSYEQSVKLPIPDKLPMPLKVHRHEGEPCPRCATTLEAVHFEDYTIAYCPNCQTGGRTLKDRRLSRLLK
ncbi:MAG TPA: DNA-formamidopyrimidine glycosylase family protein [Solirubrobacteraceae bacterium]|jgi:formamidopyrimidine-DNA glycosylase|nr:DNA-formamidopyrimidine glycosylase family protein [Solirubrobacteraceae bacterium]